MQIFHFPKAVKLWYYVRIETAKNFEQRPMFGVVCQRIRGDAADMSQGRYHFCHLEATICEP